MTIVLRILAAALALSLAAWTHGNPTAPVGPGKVLLVDGVSFLLLVDGSSKLCLASGC
jgi:hypothetical protein